MVSVLGSREINGRGGPLLEGRSGSNDPVGVALLMALLTTGSGWAAVGQATWELASQLGTGAAASTAIVIPPSPVLAPASGSQRLVQPIATCARTAPAHRPPARWRTPP